GWPWVADTERDRGARRNTARVRGRAARRREPGTVARDSDHDAPLLGGDARGGRPTRPGPREPPAAGGRPGALADGLRVRRGPERAEHPRADDARAPRRR